MLTNSSLTIYHKTFDKTTSLEKWTRYNYPNVWFFGSKGATVNKGYNPINRIEIRIPIAESIDLKNFSIGDIIVKGTLTTNISTQQDLRNKQTYNITSINNNNFGNNPHLHITGE